MPIIGNKFSGVKLSNLKSRVNSGPPTFEVLLIGGGGAGGGNPGPANNSSGAGGGAGGFVFDCYTNLSPFCYCVIIGAGGSAAGGVSGNDGGFSELYNISTFPLTGKRRAGGGGGGSSYLVTPGSCVSPLGQGQLYGGGGGGGVLPAVTAPNTQTIGQLGAVGTPTNPACIAQLSGWIGACSPAGCKGGCGTRVNPQASGAGGGGGGGANGFNGGVAPLANCGGAGGIGLQSCITGVSIYYSGGGGGGGATTSAQGTSTAGLGGQGGGGKGGIGPTQPSFCGTAGSPNTGGGGGGGSGWGATMPTARQGGNGGSGVIVIAFSQVYTEPTFGIGLSYSKLPSNCRPGYNVYCITGGTGYFCWT